MANQGNAGHQGYKMSKVLTIEPEGERVAIRLECGHVQYWTASSWHKIGEVLESARNQLQIGTTRSGKS